MYELSMETEGTKEPFVRQDWISILDNQATNYSSFQSVIDTSQLSNSDKWMNYREAFFVVPLLLTVQGEAEASIAPNSSGTSLDRAIGLKNWFGNIVHSISVDLNGTTIIQQTQLINLINTFRLLTSLSWGDICSIGSTIGFYPDTVDSITFSPLPSGSGSGFCNNGTVSTAAVSNPIVQTVDFDDTGDCFTPGELKYAGQFQTFKSQTANIGFVKRNQWISFDPQAPYSYFVTNPEYGNPADAIVAATNYSLITTAIVPGGVQPGYTPCPQLGGGANNVNALYGTNITYSQVMSASALQQLWKGYIFNKSNGGGGVKPIWQSQNMVKIYLKHLHPFFQKVPLTKGVFMRFTMYFNCCTVNLKPQQGVILNADDANTSPASLIINSITAPLNGTVPLMIASAQTVSAPISIYTSSARAYFSTNTSAQPNNGIVAFPTHVAQMDSSILGENTARAGLLQPMIVSNSGVNVNLSVGYKVLDPVIQGSNVATGPLGQSVQLVLPAYTMNPVFEQAYLTNSVKQIKYLDYFQYLPTVAQAGANFNQLITNGIAGLREIVIFPFMAATQTQNNKNTLWPWGTQNFNNYAQYQNPFDSAGGGTVCPLSMLSQFNVLLSGQNMSYSTIRYSFEEFSEQFYGRSGAVNAGLTDGVTSGLIDEHSWEMGYGAYYIDLSRMLAVEDSVPKSVSIQGYVPGAISLQFVVFLGFEVSIGLDVLTGARV